MSSPCGILPYLPTLPKKKAPIALGFSLPLHLNERGEKHQEEYVQARGDEGEETLQENQCAHGNTFHFSVTLDLAH